MRSALSYLGLNFRYLRDACRRRDVANEAGLRIGFTSLRYIASPVHVSFLQSTKSFSPRWRSTFQLQVKGAIASATELWLPLRLFLEQVYILGEMGFDVPASQIEYVVLPLSKFLLYSDKEGGS